MACLPEIHTARTVMTPFKTDYITPKYISWLNDLQTMQYSRQRFGLHNEASCREFLQSFEESPHHFSAILTKKGNHIGNISTTIDVHNQISDISLLIGQKFLWGQGYGSEVWSSVMEALIVLNTRLITGGCMSVNKAMVKIMENAGMRPYYVRRNFFMHGNEKVDSVHYVSENILWK